MFYLNIFFWKKHIKLKTNNKIVRFLREITYTSVDINSSWITTIIINIIVRRASRRALSVVLRASSTTRQTAVSSDEGLREPSKKP